MMFFPNKVNLHTHGSVRGKQKKQTSNHVFWSTTPWSTAEQRDKHATRELSTGPGREVTSYPKG